MAIIALLGILVLALMGYVNGSDSGENIIGPGIQQEAEPGGLPVQSSDFLKKPDAPDSLEPDDYPKTTDLPPLAD